MRLESCRAEGEGGSVSCRVFNEAPIDKQVGHYKQLGHWSATTNRSAGHYKQPVTTITVPIFLEVRGSCCSKCGSGSCCAKCGSGSCCAKCGSCCSKCGSMVSKARSTSCLRPVQTPTRPAAPPGLDRADYPRAFQLPLALMAACLRPALVTVLIASVYRRWRM